MSKLNIFIPINKIDEEKRLVYGRVAAEVLDNAGEMFDYDGSKDYFAKWSDNAYETSGGKSHGNLRVMHTSKVAGLISSPLGFDDDEKTIDAVAHVVDDDEWKKVTTGCYTGFSMGGRYVSRAKKNAKGIVKYIADPVEISLVDKPCIPNATFQVIKADGVIEDRAFDESLFIKSEDLAKAEQERDEKGRFAAGGGDSVADNSSHGGADPSGHGGTGASASVLSPKEIGEKSAKSDANHVERQHGKDPEQLRAVADQHDKVVSNYEKAGVHSDIVQSVRENASAVRAIADKWAGAQKADIGEDQMYVPTNDEILPVATGLAKAAGKTGDADWLDFVEQATADLIAKHDGTPPVATPPVVEEPVIEPVVEDAAKADVADEHDAAKCDKADCEKCAAEKGAMPDAVKDKIKGKDRKDGGADEDAKDGGKDDATEDDAKKADTPDEYAGLEQKWVARDGSLHVRKSDAIKANRDVIAAIAKSDSPLIAQLQAMNAELEVIAKGDVVDGPSPRQVLIDLIEPAMEKFTAFLDVAKGMYTVARLASLIGSMESLHSSVVYEEGAENDTASGLPAASLAALTSLGKFLIDMATEEVKEIAVSGAKGVVSMDASPYPDICEYAVTTLGLEKADFDELVKASVVVAPVSDDETLTKMAALEASNTEALAKADKLESDMAAIEPLLKGMQEQINKLKDMPLPKAPTTNVAEKSDNTVTAEDLLAKYTPDQLADAAFKISHQRGQHFVLPSGAK